MAVVTGLASRFGARVTNCNIHQTIGSAKVRLYEALLRHKILVVPTDGKLSQDKFLALFRALSGGSSPEKQVGRGHAHGEFPEVFIISNRAADERFQNQPDKSPFLSSQSLAWHSDLSYRRRPGSFTMLMAEHLPPRGGETSFADHTAALDALRLPADASESVALQEIRHIAGGKDPVAYLSTLVARHAHPEPHMNDVEGQKPVLHPVVRQHPITGENALYVNEMFTREINGAPEALLPALVAHCQDKAFRYEHRWSPGDVVIWDNRTTTHARGSFNGPRSLWRTHALGERPLAGTVVGHTHIPKDCE